MNKKGTYFADSAVHMWTSPKDYVTLLIFEMKKSLGKPDIQDGEKEIVKYSHLIMFECELDTLYSFLVGMDAFIIYKFENGKLYKSAKQNIGFPEKLNQALPSNAFKSLLEQIFLATWATFEKNLINKDVKTIQNK